MERPDRDPFADLVDDARAGEARRARVAQRSLERQAAEAATLAGTLVDLAEEAGPVVLRTRSGRLHRGPILGVGGDFVVVGDAWVRLDAVVAVRAEPGRRSPDAGGERRPTRDVRLADVLADLAAERPEVVVVPADGGEALRGVLRAGGADVLTLALDGDPRSRCYVSLGAVAEVVVRR